MRTNFAARRPRGSILITTMIVCFALAAIVLVLSRKMAVEAIASANTVAATQADSIERGAEQYLLSLLNVNDVAVMDPNTITEDYFSGVQIGDGYFWVLRPNYDDPGMPTFGLVDECSKLDINYDLTTAAGPRNAGIFYQQLLMITGMTEEMAAAVIDWQDTDQDPYQSIGAELAYYAGLEDAYQCKDLPFESVEELLMVRDFDHTALYGDGSAAPLGFPAGSVTSSGPSNLNDPELARGWYDLFTVNAYSAAAGGGGGGGGGGGAGSATIGRGLININTAPAAVLRCLGAQNQTLDENDVQALVSQRASAAAFGLTDTTWASDAIGTSKFNQLNTQITGQSYRYSADILAVSGNGRAFKRVRIVIDAQSIASGTPAKIIWRRDVTDQGWPMDPQLLADIRSGAFARDQNNQGMSFNTGGSLR